MWLKLCQEQRGYPVVLIYAEEMVKTRDTILREKFQVELAFFVHELKIEPNKVLNGLHIDHIFLNRLFYNVVQGIEKFVIDGLCFLAEVELVLAHDLVETFAH